MSEIQDVLKAIDLLCKQNEDMQQQLENLKAQVRTLNFIEDKTEYNLAEKNISQEILNILEAVAVNKKYGVSIDRHSFEHASLTKEIEYFEDELGDISKHFPQRTDEHEHAHFEKIMDYVNSILNVKHVSRYQLGSPKEAGVSIMTVDKINRSKTRQEEAAKFKKKPYVGRIDFYNVGEDKAESFYIGDESFADENHDLFVVRWSDDNATLFYDRDIGTVREYKGLGKIKLDYTRQIDTVDGKLVTLYPPIQVGDSMKDVALEEALTKQSSNMDLITATIGRSQYSLITSPFNETLIVQGSAGSGKSIIALYRLSYLLDKSKEGKLNVKFFEDSIAFFGPNVLFLKHINATLKGLGNEAIIKSTLHDYVVAYLNEQLKSSESLTLRTAAHSLNTVFKGSLHFKERIEQNSWQHLNNIKPFTQDFEIELDNKTYKLHGIEIALAYERSLKLNYNDRKNNLKSHIEGKIVQTLKEEVTLKNTIQDKLNIFVADVLNKIERAPFYLSEETELLLHETAQLVKKENLKEEIYVYPIAKTKDAQNLKKSVNKAINKELQNYINTNYRLIQKEIIQRYNTWIKSDFEEELEAYLETAYKQEMRELLSEKVRNRNEEQLFSLKMVVEEFAKEEEAELTAQFMATKDMFVQTFYKLVMDETKPHVFALFNDKLENNIKLKIRRDIESEYKATLLLNKIYTKLITKTSELSDAAKYQRLSLKVKSFLDNKFIEGPVELYKMVLDNYSTKQKVKGGMSLYLQLVDGRLEILKEDVMGIFQAYLIMQGTAYTKPLHYAVIDEAQDLYPFEIWAARQLCKANGIMLFGDLGQNINRMNQFDSWEIFSQLLGNVKYYNLEANYRSTKQIVEYCNAIIMPYAKDKYLLPEKTFRIGEEVIFLPYAEWHLADFLAEYEGKLNQFEKIAIICKDAHELNEVKQQVPAFNLIEDELKDENSFIITTVAEVKGLQFDCVIIPNETIYSDDDFERKLHYVAATRALHQLIIFR